MSSITFITPVFHPSVGGVQTHTQALANGLARCGCSVTVVTADVVVPFRWYYHRAAGYAREENLNDVRVVRVKAEHALFWRTIDRICQTPLRGGYRLLSWSLGQALDVFQGPWVKMGEEILRSKPDVQILMWPYFRGALDCIQIRKENGIPLVTIPIFHTLCEQVTPTLKSILDCSDMVCPSTALSEKILISAGIEEHKFKVLGCGIHEDAECASSSVNIKGKYELTEQFQVCYLGRLDPAKGVLDLISAFQELVDDGCTLDLVLAGATCPGTDNIMCCIDNLPPLHKERIRVVSDFPAEDKQSLLAAMDVVVLPSVAESFGIAVLEAWASCKPVIVCENTAPSHLVEEANGGLCYPSGDIRSLASAIRHIMNNADEARAFGGNGHSLTFEKYTWKRISSKLLTVCESLL